jgi:polar amino acid transport system substrate-binding protein
MRMLAAREANVFVGDRAQLLDAAMGAKGEVVVLERLFRRDVVALALRRNDDAFRLVVDRALSRLYRSGEIFTLYGSHFGAPSATVLEFFQLVALPD